MRVLLFVWSSATLAAGPGTEVVPFAGGRKKMMEGFCSHRGTTSRNSDRRWFLKPHVALGLRRNRIPRSTVEGGQRSDEEIYFGPAIFDTSPLQDGHALRCLVQGLHDERYGKEKAHIQALWTLGNQLVPTRKRSALRGRDHSPLVMSRMSGNTIAHLGEMFMLSVQEGRSGGPLPSRPPTGTLDGRGGARRFMQ